MKTCRSLTGLLKAIENKESCCLKYTDKAITQDSYIIYLQSGTNLIITDKTYEQIKDYLVRI
jgi:Tfp pilus assembly protein PilZ